MTPAILKAYCGLKSHCIFPTGKEYIGPIANVAKPAVASTPLSSNLCPEELRPNVTPQLSLNLYPISKKSK
jgi:hypothetical protein